MANFPGRLTDKQLDAAIAGALDQNTLRADPQAASPYESAAIGSALRIEGAGDFETTPAASYASNALDDRTQAAKPDESPALAGNAGGQREFSKWGGAVGHASNAVNNGTVTDIPSVNPYTSNAAALGVTTTPLSQLPPQQRPRPVTPVVSNVNGAIGLLKHKRVAIIMAPGPDMEGRPPKDAFELAYRQFANITDLDGIAFEDVDGDGMLHNVRPVPPKTNANDFGLGPRRQIEELGIDGR